MPNMNEIKCSNAQVVPPAVSDIIKNKGDNECKIRTIYSTIKLLCTKCIYCISIVQIHFYIKIIIFANHGSVNSVSRTCDTFYVGTYLYIFTHLYLAHCLQLCTLYKLFCVSTKPYNILRVNSNYFTVKYSLSGKY